MMRISVQSLYGFKEDYCRYCVSNPYYFNDIATFVDTHNHNLFNTDKMSWKSYYPIQTEYDERLKDTMTTLRMYR